MNNTKEGSASNIYADNKYNSIYFRIINKALSENRIKHKGDYYESHHINPKGCGGIDEESNTVLLTAKEHFVCHHLLTKFITEQEHLNKMTYAFWAMCNQRTGDVQRHHKISSNVYSKARENFAKVNSKRHKGKKMPASFSELMSKRWKNNPISTQIKGKDNFHYGKKRPLKDVLKIRLNNIKYYLTKTHGLYITPMGSFRIKRMASTINGFKGKGDIDEMLRDCPKQYQFIKDDDSYCILSPEITPELNYIKKLIAAEDTC